MFETWGDPYSNHAPYTNGYGGRPMATGEIADLRFTIVGATGLRVNDPTFDQSLTCDPYCIVQIEGKDTTEFNTEVIEDSCDPQWNHVQDLPGYNVGDPLTFVIMDKGRASGTSHQGEVVGACTLQTSRFFPQGFDGVLPLTDVGRGSGAQLRLRIVVLGAQAYPRQGNAPAPQPAMPAFDTLGPPLHLRDAPTSLRVEIQRAEGLRNADHMFFGKSDPYCICEVPNKSHTRFQTKHLNNTCNPVWNHSHDIIGYVAGDPLLFTVMDKDLPPKRDEVLGKALLESDQFYPHGIEGEIELSEAGRGVRANLRVRITVTNAPGGLDFWSDRELRSVRESLPQPEPPRNLLGGSYSVVSKRPTTREELIASRNLLQRPPVLASQKLAPPPTPPPAAMPPPAVPSAEPREVPAASQDSRTKYRMFMQLQDMMPDIAQDSRQDSG